jgi:DNA-binding transcriptional LysR family regulator
LEVDYFHICCNQITRVEIMLAGIDIFVAVVEADSFTQAAAQLGKSASYVSKAVSRLENELGARLLNRTTRSLSLTDAGRSYFEQCRAIVAEAEQAALMVSEADHEPRGVLKVSAPVSFGISHLAAALPDFLRDAPELKLDIELNDRKVDVVADGFDVVLRVGQLADTSLIAKRIATVTGVTAASPAYWDARGRPQHPAELANHTCIAYSLIHAPNRWQYRDQDGRPTTVDVASRVICNSAELECALAVAGMGVIRMPEFACQAEIEAGRLEPVLEDYARAPFGIYAVYPHRRHLSAKVRAFVDFLVDRFGD